MKPLGILGGSFDPIHNGHTMLARDVYEQLGLEQVIFVPAYIAPHKIGHSFASPIDRYRMTELAITGVPYFSISDIEFKKKDISYTVDTMRIMKKIYSSQDLFFIIGADSVAELKTWNGIDELFDLVKFAVVYRPGYDEKIDVTKQYFGKKAERIMVIHTPEYAVSSTTVRDNVLKGLPLSGMVAPAVEKYIWEHGLYK